MTNTITFFSALTLSFLAGSVLAAVSPEQAKQLGASLTPIGAEQAGNAAGSIPEWTGGLAADAAQIYRGGFVGDPYAGEEPQFVITAQNAEQYKDNLTNGQLALFKRYPDSYRIPVYPTHRSATLPERIYDAVKVSALNTGLIEGGNGLTNFAESRYYAFPIPQSGVEVVWNHITRYRGGNLKRSIVQAAPLVNGAYSLVHFDDEVAFPGGMPDLSEEDAANILFYYKQRVTAPSRLAGNVTLAHETLNQIKEPRMAWVYNAGQRRVRRAPQVAYDGPGTASDGLRTSDNLDMFNGSPNQYDWQLIGKREVYIPNNNYRLASPELKYADILKEGHINQDLTRYELHRVWEVEATLKGGKRNVYAKRRFYLDEDTWQIAESELYDGRGELWRVGEAQLLMQYDKKVPAYALEVLYDLIAGRYIAIGMSNEERNTVQYGVEASAKDFTPTALRNDGVR
tara:strand:+ start:23797 stop:25164 length:1368 start_codon:yes stop_codon:yes gene_type:complete